MSFAELERRVRAEAEDEEKIGELRKPAWFPVIEPGEGENPNKFGGRPWLGPDDELPRCDRCGGPTSLALQLDLESLPTKTRTTGLLQVFLCDGKDPGDCFIEDSDT